MPAQEFDYQSGIINAIRMKTEDGRTYPVVDIQAHKSLGIVKDVQIDTPLSAQHIPRIGQIVAFTRTEKFGTRVVAVWGERPFDAPIEPGEVLVESTGGGWMYLNKLGDTIISDDVFSNVLKMLSNIGVLITTNALKIKVRGVGEILISPDEDKIEITKTQSKVPVSKVTLTNDAVSIDANEVEVGTLTPTNPLASIKGGNVVSLSNVTGDHSIDIFTGRPIPSSATVKSTIFPDIPTAPPTEEA